MSNPHTFGETYSVSRVVDRIHADAIMKGGRVLLHLNPGTNINEANVEGVVAMLNHFGMRSTNFEPTGTEARVCADIAARQAVGVAKYGTTVEANNLTLEQWLQHAYEETLDQAVYLRRALEQIRMEQCK